jgi:alpha-tubulin suppressor-like RCC1 family protein
MLFVALWTAVASCGGDASVTQPFAPDTPQPAGRRIVSITSAFRSTCVLTDAGTVFCWGENRFGEFGDGTTQPSSTPIAGAGGLHFARLYGSTGTARMCGLDAGAQAFCWGYNINGEVGNGTTDPAPTPSLVIGGHRFTTIASSYHTCGLEDAARAYCWGPSIGGELGDGTTDNFYSALSPQAVVGATRYTAITNGTEFTCALQESGSADCWGWGVGLGSGPGDRTVSTPTPVSGGLRFARISAASDWVCALTVAGAPYCWGNTGDSLRTAPTPVPTNLTFREIVAVSAHGACALTQAGEAYCWYERTAPQLVPGHHQFAGLGSGLSPDRPSLSADYCGYTAGGAGYCWYWGTIVVNGQAVPELTDPQLLPPLP